VRIGNIAQVKEGGYRVFRELPSQLVIYSEFLNRLDLTTTPETHIQTETLSVVEQDELAKPSSCRSSGHTQFDSLVLVGN
jgi:hypothetical protein